MSLFISVRSVLKRLALLSFHSLHRRIAASPLAYRLARGAWWSIAGAVISRGSTLASSVVTARLVGRELFGEIGIIQSTVGMFAAFAGLGMGLTATKHVAELRACDPGRTGRILGLSSAFSWIGGGSLALALCASAAWIAEMSLAAPQIAGSLKVSSLLILFGTVSGAQNGALAGFEAFKRIAVVSFWSGLASFPLTVIGAWFGGVRGVVWALVIGQALTVLLNHLALKEETAFHHIPILWRSASSEWKVLWTFSFPAVLSGALSGPVNWAANSIFVNEAQGYSTMGVFSAANQFRQFILFTPGVMAGVLLPILSSLRGVRADDQYTRVFKANLLLSASCSLFVAIPIALLAPWIMAGYGDAFRAGSSVLIILAAVGVLMATINVVGQAMASEERMWGGFVLNAIWALVFLVCCYSLRHRGAVGLAGANLVAYTVHLATVSLYVRYCLSTQSYRSRENYVAT